MLLVGSFGNTVVAMTVVPSGPGTSPVTTLSLPNVSISRASELSAAKGPSPVISVAMAGPASSAGRAGAKTERFIGASQGPATYRISVSLGRPCDRNATKRLVGLLERTTEDEVGAAKDQQEADGVVPGELLAQDEH